MKEELNGTELRRRAREKYEAMTLTQLQQMCEHSWLDTEGRREDLVNSLIQYDADCNDWPVS